MSHSSEQEIIARLSHAPCGKAVVNHLSENCAHSMLNACRWCAMCAARKAAQLDTLELYSGVELCFQTLSFFFSTPSPRRLPLQP